MKRAKLMLSAIAVMAVVGGSLAFTAKKSTKRIFCQSSVNSFCNVPVTGITTIPNDDANPTACAVPGVTLTSAYGLTTSAGPCPTLVTDTPIFLTAD